MLENSTAALVGISLNESLPFSVSARKSFHLIQKFPEPLCIIYFGSRSKKMKKDKASWVKVLSPK